MNVDTLKSMQAAERAERSETYFGERVRSQRYTNALSGAQFASALILTSKELDRGIKKHLAIRELRIVEIFEVPMGQLEWFNAACNETPEVFQ